MDISSISNNLEFKEIANKIKNHEKLLSVFVTVRQVWCSGSYMHLFYYFYKGATCVFYKSNYGSNNFSQKALSHCCPGAGDFLCYFLYHQYSQFDHCRRQRKFRSQP